MKNSIFTLVLALIFSATTFAQLTGSKTVPGDYPTVAAAIADLNINGVGGGGVTFNVAAGHTETFATAMTGLITASGTAGSPIVFQKSGEGANPLITAGVGTTTNLDGIIVIAGGDYITFDAIDLKENDENTTQVTRMEFGYALVKASNVAPVNGCQYITIRNCNITMNPVLTATTWTNCTGIYSGNHTATAIQAISLNELADAMNNGKFFGNTITNVTNGIIIQGWVGSNDFYEQNNEIGVDGGNQIIDHNNTAINARYQKNLKVANNNIFTSVYPSTTLNGINIQNTLGGAVYDNTISYQPAPPSTGLFARTMNGITVYLGETNDFGSVYGNVVENCTSPVTTSFFSFTGISSSSSITNLEMHNNIVRNITISGTGGFTGITSGSPINLEFYENQVYNITKTGTGGAFTGINVGGQGTINAYKNLVYAGYNATAAVDNQGAGATGINIGNGNPVNVFGNRVYDLKSYGGSASVSATGINVNNAQVANIYNNFISELHTPAAPFLASNISNVLAGISMSTQPKVVNIYFNTVYLNSSSTTVNNFFSAAVVATPSPVVDLRNNILVNLSTPSGTGVAAAYRRQTPSLDGYSMLSNSNVLYAGDVEDDFHAVFYHGALSAVPPIPAKAFTFDEFQAFVGPVRDAGSFRHLPPFINTTVSPYDLHLIDGFPTPCESNGIQITSPVAITTDFDGDLRSSAPDIGADEFNGIAIGIINPGGVSAYNISSHEIIVEFSPNQANNNVVIVWNTTGVFEAPFGTPPAFGEPFAGGLVLSNGVTSPINHSGLAGATFYYYKAFSFDGYEYSLGVVAGAITNIAPPSNFTATAAGSTQIDLSWTINPFGNDVIIASHWADEFGQPANGTAYEAGDELPMSGTVIYVGPLSGFSHTGLEPNIVTYYYKAWSVDPDNGNVYSPTGVTANAATLCSSASIPYFESFEYGGTTVGCGSVLDANNNSDTWFANFGFARTGAISLRSSGGFNIPPKDDWYFTNALELTAGHLYEVKFWYRTQNLNGARHGLQVKWGNGNNVAGMTSEPIYYTDDLTPLTSYVQITCTTFSPSETGLFFVGWHNFTPGAPGHALFMEDITVTEIPLPAPPTMLTAAANLSTISLAYNLNAAGNQVIIATNGSSVFGNPSQGAAYNVGDVIGGNGTVIYKGTLEAFDHTSLDANTTYYYKAWSVDANNYYSVGITADATTGSFQVVCPTIGWGGISSYLIPENAAVESVMAEIKDEMQIMLGTSGFYWPGQNINTLGNWDYTKGYKLKMNQPACFHMVGEMSENKTIMVPQGASYIPVLCDQPVAAGIIFSQFNSNLLFAYDLTSQQLYWPDGQIFTLETLEPGRGYLVNMTQAGQATFSCGEKSNAANFVGAQQVVYENAPWSYSKSGAQHFISINQSALSGLEKGDFIGVFNAQGDCMGFTQYNGEAGNLLLVAYGDDVTTNETDGLLDGEQMSFRVFRTSEMMVEAQFNAAFPGTDKFADMGQSMIMKIGDGATAIGENQLSEVKLYPNPGSGVFTLEIPAIDNIVTISVENSLGQVIYTAVVEANQTGSAQQLNLTSATSGLYFVKITSNNETLVSKLIVR